MCCPGNWPAQLICTLYRVRSQCTYIEVTSERKSCKGFFKIHFLPMRALEFITGHMVYNMLKSYRRQPPRCLRPGICVKKFFRSLKKPVTRENWEKPSVYFFWYNCKFHHSKIKKFVSVFYVFFEGTRKNDFIHILGLT